MFNYRTTVPAVSVLLASFAITGVAQADPLVSVGSGSGGPTISADVSVGGVVTTVTSTVGGVVSTVDSTIGGVVQTVDTTVDSIGVSVDLDSNAAEADAGVSTHSTSASAEAPLVGASVGDGVNVSAGSIAAVQVQDGVKTDVDAGLAAVGVDALKSGSIASVGASTSASKAKARSKARRVRTARRVRVRRTARSATGLALRTTTGTLHLAQDLVDSIAIGVKVGI